MGKIVRRTLAEAKLNASSREELVRLANRPDSEIDLSDIPELTEKFWENAVMGRFYRPVKKQVTVRIDADVLEWLRKKAPEGYQSHLNKVLRDTMLEDLMPKQKRA